MLGLRLRSRGIRFVHLLPLRRHPLLRLSQLLQSVRRRPLCFVSEQLQRLSGGLLQQLLGDLSRLQTPPLPCLSRRKALQCVP